MPVGLLYNNVLRVLNDARCPFFSTHRIGSWASSTVSKKLLMWMLMHSVQSLCVNFTSLTLPVLPILSHLPQEERVKTIKPPRIVNCLPLSHVSSENLDFTSASCSCT